jgi:hypothetical protein
MIYILFSKNHQMNASYNIVPISKIISMHQNIILYLSPYHILYSFAPLMINYESNYFEMNEFLYFNIKYTYIY